MDSNLAEQFRGVARSASAEMNILGNRMFLEQFDEGIEIGWPRTISP